METRIRAILSQHTKNEAKNIFQTTHLLIMYQKLGYHFQIQKQEKITMNQTLMFIH